MKDTISFLINKIIYLDYSISIENELINIEGFTYDYNIPELIENVEVYKSTWENGKKIKRKIRNPNYIWNVQYLRSKRWIKEFLLQKKKDMKF